PGDRLGHPLVPRRALPLHRVTARGELVRRAHRRAEPGHLRAVRAVLRRRRGTGLRRTPAAEARPAGLPGTGRVPGLLEGLVTAVRAVAAAAGGTGPAPLGSVPRLAGRRGAVLLRVLRRADGGIGPADL